MSIKSSLCALIAAVLPGLGMAQGCHDGMDSQHQAMSWVTGMHWDAEAGICVPVASS